MQRFLLKKGDRSTAGGTVIEGIESCTHHGTPLTFVGAKVYCPACKTTGFVGAKGPRWPDQMMGTEQALEGDICICKCDPPPTMIASQRDSFHQLTSDDVAAMGYDASTISTTTASRATQIHSIYDEQFTLKDCGGCVLPETYYTIQLPNGELLHGITDSAGRTERHKTNGAQLILLYLGHQQEA